MFLPDLIAAESGRLTPTERRIADVVTREPTLLAFGTVTDLAGRVGTSRPSIMRFATKLGFAGYTDLQEQVRAGMSRQLSRPSERIRRAGTALGSARAAIEAATRSVFTALDDGRLAALSDPIVGASRVWVVSGETSRAGAYALHSGLAMLRPGVHLIEEHTSARDLSGTTTGDAAVVFDFRRYRRHSVAVARKLTERGVHLVAITDGPLSPLASLTESWCALEVPAVGPFDSSVPAVIAAELLVARVATQLQEQARERIDQIEAMWEATGTFL